MGIFDRFRSGSGEDWPPRRDDDDYGYGTDEREAPTAASAERDRIEFDSNKRTTDSPLPSLRQARRARKQLERDEVRRFTRRARNRRNVLWGIAGLTAFVIAFVAIGVFTPLFSVREVAVTGVERADRDAIEASLKQLEGQPLAQVTDADVGALLDQFVLVQSYSVRTEPPSTLVVDVVERVPVGAIAGDDGAVMVDAVGTELWRADQLPEDIPVLRVSSVDAPGFQAAAKASIALDHEFRKKVAEISANTLDSVTLTLRDGTLVVWGSAEESDRKAQVLEALVAASGGQPAYFDVSSPDNPVSRDTQP